VDAGPPLLCASRYLGGDAVVQEIAGGGAHAKIGVSMASSVPPPSGGRRRWPRVVALLLPAILFIAVLAAATLRKVENLGPGSRAPNFTSPLLGGGGSVTLSDLRGKPVLLNFWASWCAPCRDEAPLLERAFATYGDSVHFLGVDLRDARTEATRFQRTFRIGYRSVRDEGFRIYDDYGLTGQPETFFIDQNGIVVQHVPGPLTRQELFDLLDVLVRRNA
jgi:cytochrome c biogenesis protein CcmG, thiol:disulfide interchange protein DsbE